MRSNRTHAEEQKREKFDFEKMKVAATHENSEIRKRSFIEYFDRFQEFPSYLFDNDDRIDARLRSTIKDLLDDPETTREVRKGIDTLLQRLPFEQTW